MAERGARTHPESLALQQHRAAIRERLLRSGAARSRSNSVSWTINREVVVVAGWGRGILLQLAHPLIAAAISEHSSFRGDVVSGVRRLFGTISAMLALTFGTDEEAIAAAARINRIHDRVAGQRGERAGTPGPTERYSAHDPDLLRWVHATLLESLPLAYERLVGPLTPDERDRYCAEGTIIEPLLDVPLGVLPRSSAQLADYMREMQQSGRLIVTDRSRMLARAFLFPSGWWLMWPAFRALQLFTIGLLPPELRDAYGFAWTARDARALARWSSGLRLLRRATPRFLREWPAARRQRGSVR